MENYSKEELKQELIKRGFTNIGPITATTRKLYINKLLKDDDKKGNIFALSSDEEFKETTTLKKKRGRSIVRDGNESSDTTRSRNKHKDVLNTVASNLVRGNLVRVISYDLLNLIYLIIIQFLYDYI